MKKLVLIFNFIFTILIASNANAQIKIRDILPEIILKNQEDKTINTNQFKGKIILVDFWASWCAPCRIANKKLAKMYNLADKNKFEIIGISLDTDSSKWLKAIQKDKLLYTQLLDNKGFEAKSAVIFGVEQLPASYLFDANGKLIIINPTEEEIKKQINF